MAVFYGNDAFSIVELSTEEWYSRFSFGGKSVSKLKY